MFSDASRIKPILGCGFPNHETSTTYLVFVTFPTVGLKTRSFIVKRICMAMLKGAMPITPYLVGQPFEPELIREMSLALESVCDTLNLRLTDDANTRLVASKIIELAQRGVRDAATLSAMTLKEFKHH
jgi:hypothetical protein